MLRGPITELGMCRRHFYFFKEQIGVRVTPPGHVQTSSYSQYRVCDRGRGVGVQIDRTIDVPGIPSGEVRRSQILQQPRAHHSGARSSLDKYRTCPERELGSAGQCQHRLFFHLESAGQCQQPLFQCLESTGRYRSCRHQMFDIQPDHGFRRIRA